VGLRSFNIFFRRRRHRAVLARIAELEQDLGLAVEEQKTTPSRGATVMAPFTNYPQVFDVHEPPKKKPEPFVPVLDESYFERKRPALVSPPASWYDYSGSSHYGGYASSYYYGRPSYMPYPPPRP
jgi:hypothetical protein